MGRLDWGLWAIPALCVAAVTKRCKPTPSSTRRDFRALVVLWFLRSFLLRLAMGGVPHKQRQTGYASKGPFGPSIPDYPPVHPMLQTITPYTITIDRWERFLQIIMLTFLAVASRATIACTQRWITKKQKLNARCSAYLLAFLLSIM